MAPSNSLANAPSSTSEAVVITTVSGSRRAPIDDVSVFLRSAPLLVAVSRAWAYSSMITSDALRPSCVLALPLRHRINAE